MGDKSAIEWTDSTWNPTTGCTKVSQGCKNCYAERIFPRTYRPRQFTDVATHPDRLEIPLRWQRPRRIFVNSMSDLFHEDIPEQFIRQVFATMLLAKQHTFQVLTKRPERMRDVVRRFYIEGMEPLPHVWLGVSAEDQATADERIPLLLQTPAAVRFISAEPLLGPIDLRQAHTAKQKLPRVNWVIAGGESGPKARPSHPAWFQSLRDQCAAAGVAYFFKQWGEWKPCAMKPPHIACEREHVFDDGTAMLRVGKKAAGNLLGGRTHQEYPR